MIATAELAPAPRPTAERVGYRGWPNPRSHPAIDASRHALNLTCSSRLEPAERPDDEVSITRWRRADAPMTVGPVVRGECAMLAVALSPTEATIEIDGAVVHQGRLAAGMFQLVVPGAQFEAHFRSPADFVRMYIPQTLFLQIAAQESCLQGGPESIGRPACDSVIEQLARSIVAASCGDHAGDRGFMDAIGTALLERARTVLSTTINGSTRSPGLIAWRLRRVVEFIDARLDQPLTLADMAQAAGLSRMHFAAQFRLATGLAPHAFLTRRRIEHARELRVTAIPPAFLRGTMQNMPFDELADLAEEAANGWSIGSFGAIGEFVRAPDEPVHILRSRRAIALTTDRGAMRLVDAELGCVAWDSLSSDGTGWTNNLALCSTPSRAERGTVAMLGRDRDAIRPKDRESWLVDLGVARGAVRMCVRTRSRSLQAALSEAEGTDFLASPALADAVMTAQPHRVLLSPAGRIEVYQPIPGAHDLSPIGPHTHLLPRLIGSGQLHSANDPIPQGWQAVLNLHPPRPWVGDRDRRRLDRRSDDNFHPLLARYGDDNEAALAENLVKAVSCGADPTGYAWPRERRQRAKARLVLRRLTAAGDGQVQPWRDHYDQARMPLPI